MRIIDAHCHAWETWPYQPQVPDPITRGRIEQLIHEMDQLQVDKALVVCAQIQHNPRNNAYIAQQVHHFPQRLLQLLDLDSEWSDGYHLPGSLGRLRGILGEIRTLTDRKVAGFTHYLKQEDDGAWLFSEEGLEVFRYAEEHALLVSISSYPHQQAALRRLAQCCPSLTILCHHLGFYRYGKGNAEESLASILDSARLPNIYVKVSGFAYAAQLSWEYPYPEVVEVFNKLYDVFGPERLCWGSDYPVVRAFMTYRQSLEVVRTHCKFLGERELALILGGNLERLLRMD